MSDNINFNYKNLSPFKWFVLENFPFIEADFDAITEWQLFNKIGKEINKIITSQNLVGKQAEELTNAFNDLQNYVNNYFNNLDLQEEVNKKLNEMAEDGTLEKIINQNIFSKINNDINLLKNNFKNPLHSTRLYRQLLTYNSQEQYYCHNGGFCYIGDGNIVIALNGTVDNSLSKIQVIRLSDGLVLRETVGKFYHANSICYNPNTNKLYIAPTAIDNTEKVIIELDYLSLNETNRINVDYLIGSICYDKINDNYYTFADNIQKFVCYDKDFNAIKIIDFNIPSYFNGTKQSIEYFNNSIYFMTSFPNTIFIFDLEGNCINTIDIENWIDNAFQTGETEDLTITENGDLYFSSELQQQNSDRRILNINKTSLYNNTSISNLDFDINFELNTNWSNIYVDNTKNIINPTGTKDLPFYDINEAVNFAISPYVLNKHIKINIAKSNKPYNYSYVTDNIFEIVSTTDNADDVIINGLQIRNSNILLRSITIANKFTDNTYNTSLITESDTNAKLNKCKLINNQENLFCIYNQGNLFIYGATSFTNNSNIDIQTLAGSICKDYTNSAKISNNNSFNNNNSLAIFLKNNNENTPIYVIDSITPFSNNLNFDFIKNSYFSKLRVEYSYYGNSKIKEFVINSIISNFVINDSNINDDIEQKVFEIAELTFSLQEDGIKVISNYSLSNKDTVQSEQIKINNVYLFN